MVVGGKLGDGVGGNDLVPAGRFVDFGDHQRQIKIGEIEEFMKNNERKFGRSEENNFIHYLDYILKLDKFDKIYQ